MLRPSRLRTSRPGRLGAVALVALQMAALLAGCSSPAPSSPLAAHPVERSTTLASWSGLPAALADRVGLSGLGPLLASGADSARPASAGGAVPGLQPPRDLDELMGGLLPGGLPRLPLPTPPAGDAPLAAALGVYARTLGVPLPAARQLDAQIASLEVTPRAERALAQLVLAYSQAVDLQRAATASLSDQDRLLIAGDPAAVQAWLQADPSRTPADAQAEAARLATRIDHGQLLQASDLLMRTVEAARIPLSDPPQAPAIALDSLAGPAIPAAQDSARSAAAGGPADAGAANGSAAADRPAMPGPTSKQDPWEVLDRLLPLTVGKPATPLPPLSDDLTLEQALADLADAYGFPSGERAPVPELPASLDHAIALIVDAQALGIRNQDGALQAAALVRATREAQPTLQAWAAILRSPPRAIVAPADLMASILPEALASAPSPLALASSSAGRSMPAAPAALPLHDALQHEGMSPADAARVEQTLPAPVGLALAQLLAGTQGYERAHAAVLSGLTLTQALLLESSSDVAGILARRAWSPAQARVMQDWAGALGAVPASAWDALEQARLEAVASVQAATVMLAPYTQAHQGNLPAPAASPQTAASGPVACQDLPASLSDCGNDVWLDYASDPVTPNHGILVTGFGSSIIDSTYSGGAPKLTLDLGGDDKYLITAGAAPGGIPRMADDPYTAGPGNLYDAVCNEAGYGNQCSGFHDNVVVPPPAPYTKAVLAAVAASQDLGITIDMGGSDSYSSDRAFAQGAAMGQGALGVLWDLSGDDHYEHLGDSTQAINGAQGFGAMGGLGLLVDGGGSDTYDASKVSAVLALAQGAAYVPDFYTLNSQYLAGIPHPPTQGLLLDLGSAADVAAGTSADHDSFKAVDGQGSGFSYGSFGLLLDQVGPTHYSARPRPFNQGGRGGSSDLFSRGSAEEVTPFTNRNAGRGGVGTLIDLGGQGDSYDTPVPRADGTIPDPDQGFLGLKGHGRVKQDDSAWYDLSDLLGFGLDSTTKDEDGDGCPNVVELLKGTDPHAPDCSSVPTIDPNDLVGTIKDAAKDSDGDQYPDAVEVQAGSDPNDSSSTPVTKAAGRLDDQFLCSTLQRSPSDTPDQAQCAAPGQACDPTAYSCVSLLTVGGVGDDVHDHPALVSIDLGGNDSYPAGAGGSVFFWMPVDGSSGGVQRSRGSQTFSLDLQGNDVYGSASAQGTEGSDVLGNGAALLLDLAGDDHYLAATNSQGSASSATGHGMLVDFLGNDVYKAGAGSQGTTTIAGGQAALIDLAGDDDYTFVTQGTSPINVVTNTQPSALMIDGDGTDTYRSEGARVDATGGLSPANPGAPVSVFDGQGSGSNSAFLDLGRTVDTYLSLDTRGTLVDVSSIKNDMARAGAGGSYFVDGPAALAADSDGDGTPGIVEILGGTNPTDPGSGEGTLFGTIPSGDPQGALNGADPVVDVPMPGNFVGVALPGLLIGGRGDSTYTVALPFMIDLGGSDTYLAPNLAAATLSTVVAGAATRISGGVSLVLDVEPVDAQGTIPPGAGDDVYAPTPQPSPVIQVASPTAPGSLAALRRMGASLGAGNGGIALLADVGGHNTFRTAESSSVVMSDPTGGIDPGTLTVQGFTQGAALNSGVGALVTYNASNDFTVDLTANVHSLGSSFTPGVAALGVAQGATVGPGLGLLATFGGGNDTYSVNTTAAVSLGNQDASRTIRGVTQDQAQGYEGDPMTTQGAAGFGIGGQGILFDDGGSNDFSAPHGLAQGSSAQGGLGLLWSGSGNDRYLAGPTTRAQSPTATGTPAVEDAAFSQGAFSTIGLPNLPGITIQTFMPSAAPSGVLLDGGGSDVYRLLPPTQAGSVGLSQGAGAGALLVDTAGDDLYEAPGFVQVQGAQGGSLLDLGGHDVYHAHDQAQGAIVTALKTDEATLNSPVFSLFYDGGGDDTYRLDTALPSAGQGFGTQPVGSGAGSPGVFIDAAGDDRYVYHGLHKPTYLPGDTAVLPQTPAPRTPGAAPEGCNGCYWQQTPQYGIGIDADSQDAAFAQYLALQDVYNGGPLAGTVGTLQFPGTIRPPVVARDPAGTQRVATPQEGNGTLYVFACVAVQQGVQADRLDFLLDRAMLGHAQAMPAVDPAICPLQSVKGPGGTPLQESMYRYRWDTRLPTDTAANQAFPDGEYQIKASAFFTPAASAPHADAQAVDSPATAVWLNNPPLLTILATPPLALSPTLGQEAAFTVQVSRDHQAGQGPADAGTLVSVTGRLGDGPAQPFFSGRSFAQAPLTFHFTGKTECGGPCADGLYSLAFSVQDSRAAVANDTRQVLVDGTAPASALAMPAIANAQFSTPDGGMIVSFHAQDQADLGSGNVAGVAAVVLLVLDPATNAVRETYREQPGTSAITVDGVPSGTAIRFAIAAADQLGNQESACLPGETPIAIPWFPPGVCTKAKIAQGGFIDVQTDFVRPVVKDVSMSPAFVRPGQAVAFGANVTDLGMGVDPSQVSIVLERTPNAIPMTRADGDRYGYDGWGAANGAFAGQEAYFAARVTAKDRAGNEGSRPFTGRIDDVAPRVEVLDTRYVDGLTDGLVAGRLDTQHPVTAILRAKLHDLDDASVAGLRAELGAVGIGPADNSVTCTKGTFNSEFTVWACPVYLDPDLFAAKEGQVVEVPLVATDRAGNANTTATAPIAIASEPLDLLNVNVDPATVRHDGFSVHWDTAQPGSSQVLFGKTAQLGKATELDTRLATSHDVDVTGLAPSTDYFFQVVSRSGSGVVSASPVTSVSRIHTLNGYTVELPTLGATPLHGLADLPLRVTLRAGDAPVHLAVQLQDAAQVASPTTVADLQIGQEEKVVHVDTTAFVDGLYVLLVRADRLGDFLQEASAPFLIDNTAPLASPVDPHPGSIIAERRPLLRLQVLDPLTGTVPDLASLAVEVDGASVPVAHAAYVGQPASGGQRTLEATLAQDLAEGPHALAVLLEDSAHNLGRATWSFRVDASGPSLAGPPHLGYLPGPLAGKPGGSVVLKANLTDDVAVASAIVDPQGLGGPNVTLLHVGAAWEGTVPIPTTAADGMVQVLLRATDALGNPSALPVQLHIDATAPAITQAAGVADGHTTIQVQATTSEPATLQVLVPGRDAAVREAAADLFSDHQVSVFDLRPGRDYALTLRAIDGAGLQTDSPLLVHTLDDTQPPQAVGRLQASSEREGIVTLAWTAATDDSGIDHYAIVRSSSAGNVTLPPTAGNLGRAEDASAPAGQAVRYTIQAIDLAGHAGPPVAAQVTVLALPHLASPGVTPERGTSDDPFVLRTLYWSQSGLPAEHVEAVYAGRSYPLALQTPGAACTDATHACTYSAQVRMPPTSVRDSTQVLFRATLGTRVVELPWEGALLVRTGASAGLGVADAGHKAAGSLGAPSLLLAVAGCLFLARSRRRSA